MGDLPVTEEAVQASIRAHQDALLAGKDRRERERLGLSAAFPHLLAGLAEDEAMVERGARAAFEDRYPNEDWEQLYAVQRDTWRGNFAAGLDALRAAAGEETDRG